MLMTAAQGVGKARAPRLGRGFWSCSPSRRHATASRLLLPRWQTPGGWLVMLASPQAVAGTAMAPGVWWRRPPPAAHGCAKRRQMPHYWHGGRLRSWGSGRCATLVIRCWSSWCAFEFALEHADAVTHRVLCQPVNCARVPYLGALSPQFDDLRFAEGCQVGC